MSVLVVRRGLEQAQMPSERGIHVAGYLTCASQRADRDEVERSEVVIGRWAGHPRNQVAQDLAGSRGVAVVAESRHRVSRGSNQPGRIGFRRYVVERADDT